MPDRAAGKCNQGVAFTEGGTCEEGGTHEEVAPAKVGGAFFKVLASVWLY